MTSEIISYDPADGYTFETPVETIVEEQRTYTMDELTARLTRLQTRRSEILAAQEENDTEIVLIEEYIALAEAYTP